MASFTQAMQEAYASKVEVLIYDTLELWHPSFTQPIYLVRGRDDVQARIERDADRNGGQAVQFIGAPWNFRLPEVAEDTMPQLQLTIDNVNREVSRHLELAAENPQPILGVNRPYTEHTLLDGPQIDPPIALEITSIKADAYQVSATANMEDVFNAKFPSTSYIQKFFPSLAYAS